MSEGALSPATREALRRALQAIAAGQRAEAVAVARALAGDADRGALLIGARLLFLLRLYDEALAALRRRLAADDGDQFVRRLQFAWLKRLHFEADAEAALAAWLRDHGDLHAHKAALVHYETTDRPAAALQHMDATLDSDPSAADRYRAQVRLAARAGDVAAARRAAEQALRRDPDRWLEVVESLLQLGCYDVVEQEAARRRPAPPAEALLAELALFRGRWDDAYAQAAAARQRDGDCQRALTVMVAAALLAGDLERAERDLAQWQGAISPALGCWRAELWFRRGDAQRAFDELSRVQNEVADYLAAKLMSVVVKGAIAPEPMATSTVFDGLLEGQMQALGVEVVWAQGRISGEALQACAARGLAILGGNRTPYPSIAGDDGSLRRVQVPASVRHRVRVIQHRAPWLGLDETRAALRAELARIGPHPIAECYAAEIDLWSGDYAAARAAFEDILRRAPRTTWAWIGLGASLVCLDDPASGLRTLDEGIRTMGWRGATLPVYRGEALFRLGQLDEAAAELDEACARHPGRVAAWLLRLLVADARGDGTGRDAAFAHLDLVAAPLLADAARAAGVDGWWPRPAAAAVQVAVATQALAAMRGNRSSSCGLWMAPGAATVRALAPHRPTSPPQWERQEQQRLLALCRA